jgi:hypothetical protein
MGIRIRDWGVTQHPERTVWVPRLGPCWDSESMLQTRWFRNQEK